MKATLAELAQTHEALRLQHEIQKITQEALHSQTEVAAYSSDISNAVTLYHSLENRMYKILETYPHFSYPVNLQMALAANANLPGDKLNQKFANEYSDSLIMKNDLRHILEMEHDRLKKKYPPMNNLDACN